MTPEREDRMDHDGDGDVKITCLPSDKPADQARQEREKRLAQEFRDAANDPLFMADLEEVERAFAYCLLDE
jgi:hypothetical protein